VSPDRVLADLVDRHLISSATCSFPDEKAKVFEFGIQPARCSPSSGNTVAFGACWQPRHRSHRATFALNLLVASSCPRCWASRSQLIKTIFPRRARCARVHRRSVHHSGWKDRRRAAGFKGDEMTWKDALKVGMPSLALEPRYLRSGATIIGGMLFGLRGARRRNFLFQPCRRRGSRA